MLDAVEIQHPEGLLLNEMPAKPKMNVEFDYIYILVQLTSYSTSLTSPVLAQLA